MGHRNTTGCDSPNHSGTGPGHAFQKTSPVDSVLVVIVQNLIFSFVRHGFFSSTPRSTLTVRRISLHITSGAEEYSLSYGLLLVGLNLRLGGVVFGQAGSHTLL